MDLRPRTRLLPCAACDELFRANEATCPHCGAAPTRHGRSATAAALLAALSLSSCVEEEPVYGSPVTDSQGETAADTEASETTPTTGETAGEAAPSRPEPGAAAPVDDKMSR